MKITETRLKEIGFVLWGHCQNLLDGPRYNGPRREKPCLQGFADNKDAGVGQPVHTRSLITAFVIR